MLAQTYDNIETILIDDGSRDETPTVIKPFLDQITYHRQDNAGVSVARNEGFQRSRGKYVCFLDADDWYEPNNIVQKVQYLEENEDCALVHAKVALVDEKLAPLNQTMAGAEGDDFVKKLLAYVPNAMPCPSNAMLRRSVIEDVGGFDPKLSTSADFDMWLRVGAKYRVGRIDEVLVKYRQHEGSMFSNVDLQVKDVEYIINKYKNSNLAHEPWPVFKKRFYYSVCGAYFHQGAYLKVLRYFLKYLV